MQNPFKEKLQNIISKKASTNISDKTTKQSHQKTLAGFMSIILLSVVVLVGVLIIAYTISLSQTENKVVDALAKGESKALSAVLGERMARYQDIVENLASYQNLIELMEKGTPSTNELDIMAKQLRLNNTARGSIGINVLPLDWNRTSKNHILPISYAALELIKRAQNSGEIPPAEVHGIAIRKSHIAIAAPIKSSRGRTIGVLHVGWPLKDIKALFKKTEFPGQIGLAQLENKKGILVTSNVPLSLKDDLEQVPVENSIWDVVYTSKSGVLPFITLILAGLGVLGIGIIMGVIFLQLKRLKYALRQDQAKIVEMLNRSTDGHALASPAANIYENQDTMELVARNLNNLQVSLKKKSMTEKTPQISNDEPSSSSNNRDVQIDLPSSIFRAYDIRGVVGKTLTPPIVYEIGRAIGSAAYEKGQQTVLIARDGRHSGPELSAALSEGLMASGRDVIDIGMVPTPVLYFCTHFLGADSGVMITGSHNPSNYNGLKIVIDNEALSGESIQALKDRIDNGDLLEGEGNMSKQDVATDYIDRITGDAALGRSMKVVVDAGNGVAGPIAVRLLEEMGCDVIQLYCDIDGNFPNHHPDPGKVANLEDLRAMVKNEQADIGIAFDGDGDRIGVVDSNGKIILPDRLLMLLAEDVLTRQPGADIIYDIKSTKNLANHILMAGGRPVMWKTGHSFIKAKMIETGAVLAGEMSGHIFYKERWYGFDDAIYTCARLLEIISLDGRNTSEIFAELPDSVNTPELNLTVEEGMQHVLVKRLQENADFSDAQVIDIDGLRVEFANGWGLVRASNTTPSLVFRFEADDVESLKEIQNIFRDFLLRVDSNLSLPF